MPTLNVEGESRVAEVAPPVQGEAGCGLAAAPVGAMRLRNGVDPQSSVPVCPVQRSGRMPEVGMYLARSAGPPAGAGEPAVPVTPPAVADAAGAGEGQRLRSLPRRQA